MKNLAFAIVSGLLFAISWPTYGFPLFLFIAFVPLLLIEKNIRMASHSIWKVLGYSYVSFLIFNTITTWWIYYATPFGMFFALLANSLLMSLVFVGYHIIAKRITQKLSSWVLVCLWIGFEKFHLNWEFSWPWLNLGNGFASFHKWIQWYEFTGVFGGTLWVWIVNILVFNAVVRYKTNKDNRQFIKSLLLPASVIVIGIFSSLYLYHTTTLSKETVSVLVLQPNVDPYAEKYKMTNEKMATNLIQLTESKLDSSISFVIAPETTLPKPTILSRFPQSKAYHLLHDFVSENKQIAFVSGITFINSFSAVTPPNKTANFYRNSKQWYNSYNSSFCLQSDHNFDVYHKSKLVVGVEHIPYRSILSPLLGGYMIDLGGSISTLSTQKERNVFGNETNRLAPIICYESIYGEYVTDYVKKGANFLAIITNDGWWSDSQGHKQHLSIAKLRAIENRRSIARSANTGISAIINQKGDIEQFIPYGDKGLLKASIAISKARTYYSVHGDYIFRIAMLVLVLVLLTSFTKRKQNN